MPSNKQYIIKKCEKFTRTQNMEVLQFLQEMDVKISESSDGSRVNLDKLNKQQIANLRSKIKEIDVPIDPKYQIE